MLLSAVAPRNAPVAPGTPRVSTIFQSTLPNFQCDSPEASDVPSSARCTEAEARAGVSPAVSRIVVEVTP